MATASIEGIILRKTDYSETSLVLTVLTQEGIQSFLFQGAKRKGKNGNLVSPLAILELHYYKRNDSSLGKISAIEPAIVFTEIPYDPIKSSIIFFMNEIINACIKEKDADHDLYEFIKSVIQILDLTDNYKNIPLKFLYHFTKYLGFYPQVTENPNYLDLQEGKYVPYTPNHPFYLSKEKSALLLAFSGTKFDGNSDPTISLNDRRELLHDLLNYYKVIFENFPEIQSVDVLESVLHN